MTTPSQLLTLIGRPEAWAAVAGAAGLLVLSWILRAASARATADGYAETEAPTASHRNRAVTGVATGLSLIAVGAWLAAARGILWSLPAFALGLGVVQALIAANDRYRHVSPALRRTVALSRAGLNMALVAGILIVANVIAFRYGGRVIDVTGERTYSLSTLSRKQAESLDRPVVFHLVHGRSALAMRQLDRVSELVDLYRDARPDLVRVERLDRHTELSRLDDLARRAPDLAVMRGGGVLVEYGTGDDARFAAISNQEMFEGPAADPRGAGSGRYESSFRGEDAVTSALVRLREGKTSRVAFTTGHGESGSARRSEDGAGLELWKARLASYGCEIVPVNLLDSAVPDDADLVVVAGPREPFKPQEAARLRAFADRGRPVLLCLGGGPSGLEEFLKSFNLELGPEVVLDPQRNLNGQARFVFCVLDPALRHPVTDGIAGDRAVLVVDGAPIRFLGTKKASDESASSVNTRMIPSPVLQSGPSSWAESEPDASPASFDKEKDQPAPVILGAAVSERPQGPGPKGPKPSLFLISSRSAGDDAVQAREPTNVDLLMNAVSWLRGREDSVGVPAKVHTALTLTADPGLRWRLIVTPTIVSMLGVAGLGALVYFIRRE